MSIRRKLVERLATKLLDEYSITTPPVAVEFIARRAGLRIQFQALESDISGMLFRDGDRAIIGVNSAQPRVRQRFTIAHEIGHFLLHKDEQIRIDRAVQPRFRNSISSQGTDTDEIEANLFAAELLMPRKLLIRDLSNVDEVDILNDYVISDLAQRYDVSRQALLLRLEKLGFIENH